MKFTSILSITLIASVLAFAGLASAQTTTTVTMPILYNADGQAVNTSGGTLPAGTYYLASGEVGPVTYYGDGTYYNSAAGVFGGSVYNATGEAGTFTVPAMTSTASVGIPNTGAGGDAIGVWVTLAISALASIAGALYLSRSRYEFTK